MYTRTMSRSHIAMRLFAAVMALVLMAGAVFGLPGLARADSTYTVKSGDNLSKIAKANNTSVAALVDANKVKYPCLATNPACLQIGWVLTIGAGGGGAPASGPSTYTVQSGDSMARIAKKLGVNFFDLIAANKKDHPCLAATAPCALQVGWVLNVPGGAPAPTAVPTATPAPAADTTPSGEAGADTSNYATLAVLMCGGIEASVTIFHDGQIVTQGSLHRDNMNLYLLAPGHYDVQYSAQGYSNLNRSYDLTAGDLVIEPFGSC